MIGEGTVGVSLVVGGRGWVMSGVVGCSEEGVAVAVECWVEEEEVVVVD